MKLASLLACSAAAFAAACSSPAPEGAPPVAATPSDPTASVAERDLRHMALSASDFGPLISRFVVSQGGSGLVDNNEAAGRAAAVKLSGDELQRRGRISGYEVTLVPPERESAVILARSYVELNATSEAASAMVDYYLEDSRAAAGTTSGGLTFGPLNEFAIDGDGDRRTGFRQEMKVSGSSVAFTFAFVQYGRLVGMVGVGAAPNVDRAAEVKTLAGKLANRMRTVALDPNANVKLAEPAGPYDMDRDADADIRAALAAASTDGRRVLIDFGANWCPDCVVLDRMFRTERIKSVLDANFHVVNVDVGFFDRNLSIAQRYLPKLRGISTVVILDRDGTLLTVAEEFANARDMTPDQVSAFLNSWAVKR